MKEDDYTLNDDSFFDLSVLEVDDAIILERTENC